MSETVIESHKEREREKRNAMENDKNKSKGDRERERERERKKEKSICFLRKWRNKMKEDDKTSSDILPSSICYCCCYCF